jgi:perosamine synthetase
VAALGAGGREDGDGIELSGKETSMAVEAKKKMNVPITKPALTEEEARAPFESIKGGWVTQGPKVAEFETSVAAYCGAKHGIATTSCTTGLHLALAAIGVRSGDEVIVPSFTFIASPNAILYTGATVVFCEIDPRTFNVDPADVEKRITKRTKAIMPVDQIGLACDIDTINDIAKRHGIDVVEDAAPAIGATYEGRKVGANAHQTVFSFHPRKVITTGEGGMITTDDDELAERARRLRAHAMSVSDLERHKADRPILEEYHELGFNYRMTDIQASIGLVQLRRLDELLRIRIAKARRYERELADIPVLRTPYTPPYATHTYQSYCIDLDPSIDRDDLMARLLRRGIATRRGVMASHLEKVYRERIGAVSLPVTEEKARTTMLIPLFATMTDEEQTYVVDALHEELR